MRTAETSLYEQIGGKATLEKVHRIFYDEAYQHPWLKGFFANIEQSFIEDQQTSFMSKALGGPKGYRGKCVIDAHKHIFVTAELFDLRHEMLSDALHKAGVTEPLRQQWLKIDTAFRHGIVKSRPEECVKRVWFEETIVIDKP